MGSDPKSTDKLETNSLRISKWFTQNLSTIKLATGIVFLILFGYLGLKTLSLFNLINLRI